MSRKMRYFEEYRALKGKLGGGRVRRREDASASNQQATTSSAAVESTNATGVVVLPTTPELTEIANRAVFTLSKASAELLPRLRAYPVLLSNTLDEERVGGALSPVDEAKLVTRAQRQAPNAGVRIVLTSRHLHDHWFSHTHPDQRTAIATLHS